MKRINPGPLISYVRSPAACLRSTFIMYGPDKSCREMANLCGSGCLIFQSTFSETSTRFEYDLIRSSTVGLPKKGPRNSFSPRRAGSAEIASRIIYSPRVRSVVIFSLDSRYTSNIYYLLRLTRIFWARYAYNWD